MKKKNSKKITWIVVAVLAVLALFFFYNNSIGNINNGYWNSETEECWATPNSLTGDGSIEAVSCCFNLEGRQIDCNNPDKYIGSNFLAVYGVGGGTGVPGLFSISHTFIVTNTGAVPIEKAWIDSGVWSPSNSVLSSAYDRIIGSSSIYAKSIEVGQPIAFPTEVFNLQDIGGAPGSPTTYNLNMLFKASAYGGQLSSSRDITGSITVEKELIGFKVDIGWGA